MSWLLKVKGHYHSLNLLLIKLSREFWFFWKSKFCNQYAAIYFIQCLYCVWFSGHVCRGLFTSGSMRGRHGRKSLKENGKINHFLQIFRFCAPTESHSVPTMPTKIFRVLPLLFTQSQGELAVGCDSELYHCSYVAKFNTQQEVLSLNCIIVKRQNMQLKPES